MLAAWRLLLAASTAVLSACSAAGGDVGDPTSSSGGSAGSAGGAIAAGSGAAGGSVVTGGVGATGAISGGASAGGVPSTSGGASPGGVPSTGGASGGETTGGAPAAGGAGGSIGVTPPAELFSFFVTSLRAMQEVSGSQNGFGGDLRFGETGPGAGLRGADKICATIADRSMPNASTKVWRAFLSATADENGNQVNAIDRIGEGPWYDRLGRLVAATKADLLHDRPQGADPAIIDDLPNEDGVPNLQPDPTQPEVDNHDTLTGTNEQGQLYSATATCLDWTSALGNTLTEGNPRVGHSWPRDDAFGFGGSGGLPIDINMANWMSSLDEAGCAPGVNLIELGPPNPFSPTVGSGGGYGGIYCFALIP